MDNSSPLFRRLDRDWSNLATSPASAAAVSRWRASAPALTPYRDLAEVLQGCRQRGGIQGNTVLAAVIASGRRDPLAERTALQALLPGLTRLSQRIHRRGLVGPGRAWADLEELDQDLVALTLGRIRAHAVRPPRWPASTVLSEVWERARTIAARHRREGALWHLRDDGWWDGRTDADEELWSDRLTRLLRHAVDTGLLDADAARLVFTTRVLGFTLTEVADRAGLPLSTLHDHRSRAERDLTGLLAA